MNIIKTGAIVLASLLSTNALMAQKEVTYTKMFYKDVKAGHQDLTITIDNAVANEGESKFKLKIANNTADYILFKISESKFVINGKEIEVSEKALLISPNEHGSRVVNIKGAGYNSVKSYEYILDGLYKVPADAKGIATPDFMLPASRNDFKTGPFTCKLEKVKKESAVTNARFECTYNGSKIGFIFPSKVAVKMPDEREYANEKSKASEIMLERGKDDYFTLTWSRMEGGSKMDMQKVDMLIKWNDAFTEITPDKLPSKKLEVTWDEALTNEKGK
ncbi:MAG: hypothetical protein K0Q79_268 [Flavipsychrobacter sp.]|jgi:hypothetical protein|nr:hypothetical protein [Flavipsychrobacter sp.]